MSDWWERTPAEHPSDARRWAQAEERAVGVVVPDEWPVLRRFLRVELPVVLAVCLGLAVVGASIWGEWHRWIGYAVVVTGLWSLFRRLPQLLRRDPHPLNGPRSSSLTRQQHRELQRQISGGAAVDTDHLVVARLVARRDRRDLMRGVPAIFGLVLLMVGNTVAGSHRGWPLLLAVLGMALGAAFLVVSFRRIRRTSAFLRAHPDPTPVASEAPPS
ncbi:hypothetical protein GCM10011512_02920 [Tersicoccus solisilvae]|uniref:Integral membrane protein n=1 Tax=Tersicoccus solisilvae TaxID=1882339 RepID=A0ABQ1NKU4_9MICC|nr:hypothetical protein [Tersicoccus solisilvae]GGC79721.1 hypothetical protein GCM10011512_02920 [Tersicoccus solisilvae]